jgi:hypothetical protein
MFWTMAAAGAAVLAMGVGALAAQSTPTGEGQPGWHACFDSTVSSLTAGSGPMGALLYVQAERWEADRQARLQQTTLIRLHDDSGWDDAEQAGRLKDAVEETEQHVAMYEAEAEDASATAGCIENEF